MSLYLQFHGSFEYSDTDSIGQAFEAAEHCMQHYRESDGCSVLSRQDLRGDGLTIQVNYRGSAPASVYESGEAVVAALARHAIRGEVCLHADDEVTTIKARKPHTLSEFLFKIEKRDFAGIEAERDYVTPAHIEELVAQYAQLKNWDQKAALIQLVQDLQDAQLRPIMLDFLHAPRDEHGDMRKFSKAIAVSFLEGETKNVSQYLANQEILEQEAHRSLKEEGA